MNYVYEMYNTNVNVQKIMYLQTLIQCSSHKEILKLYYVMI